VVGSINLAPGSLDGRRELAIEVKHCEVVERLQAIAHHDWKHSEAIDLSDEGLRKDIGERAGAELLVLDDKG
jgi:cardiolipin synthase